MSEILKIFGEVAGIGGLSLAVFLLLMRPLVTRAPSENITTKVINRVIFFAFLLSVLGLVSYLIHNLIQTKPGESIKWDISFSTPSSKSTSKFSKSPESADTTVLVIKELLKYETPIQISKVSEMIADSLMISVEKANEEVISLHSVVYGSILDGSMILLDDSKNPLQISVIDLPITNLDSILTVLNNKSNQLNSN
ncbi:MAG: hypothetical protein ABJ387_00535 [Balneola sp.]